ncbi:EAL domain-containing protein [Herbaspirillum sp. LeCh32-8]|uniref:EAL domain-containing protein n=1 Tax=Herbaspirillum sp. LeCh32-8 TaxID=2821356 RepID=UPI001AE6BF24|nr:EAL domain-containing protein [Herbaspirillum sp. LeCh32-8]MBP0600165.1 EAL domain-containing protein [Herbaspirillum sp. LeCh32-8]
MAYQALDAYLQRLNGNAGNAGTSSKVWLDDQGRAVGRFFNTSLTSAFQAVRSFGDGEVIAWEAFARSYSEIDDGLHLWKLLDQAASDDESVELDRLCRMLHAINYYRQADAAGDPAPELHLSVHARLLAAVNNNHGVAYRRILSALELPHERIVLQLPVVTPNQRWLLNYVLDNYRRNGFRLGVSANSPLEALGLLDKVKPDLIKVDARELADPDSVALLLLRAAEQGVRIFFKRVENREVFDKLEQYGSALAQPIHAQGYLWDTPGAQLRRGSAGQQAA